EFKAETSSYLARALIKFHYAFGPLKRSTIDTSCNGEVYAVVKRCQVANQVINSLSFFLAIEPDVNFDLRLRRYHVASSAASYNTNVEGCAKCWIAHPVKPLGLTGEFQNGAGPRFGV